MKMPPPAVLAAMEKHPEGSRVMSHCVPTRIIRILDVYDDGKTYRVEQFTPSATSIGEWKSLSTHTNKKAYGALMAAFEHAHKAQATLIGMVQQQQRNAQAALAKNFEVLGAHNIPKRPA